MNNLESELETAVSENHVGERLDRFVASQTPISSRTVAQRLIEEGRIKVDGTKVSKHHLMKLGEKVSVSLPEAESSELEAVNIPIDIVYEDENLVVVNKPAGLVVHPAHGHRNDTLVNALLYHLKGRLSGIGGVIRPGIVHRLDKDTSGLLVVAKNEKTHEDLSRQIRTRRLKRIYLALVYGTIEEDKGTISAPIGRDTFERKRFSVRSKMKREAVTHFKVLKRFKNHTLVEAELETGRTHQIRVHFSLIGHHVVGDPVYGRKKEKMELKRQFLHASRLNLINPATGKEMLFTANLPPDLKGILELLRAEG